MLIGRKVFWVIYSDWIYINKPISVCYRFCSDGTFIQFFFFFNACNHWSVFLFISTFTEGVSGARVGRLTPSGRRRKKKPCTLYHWYKWVVKINSIDLGALGWATGQPSWFQQQSQLRDALGISSSKILWNRFITEGPNSYSALFVLMWSRHIRIQTS